MPQVPFHSGPFLYMCRLANLFSDVARARAVCWRFRLLGLVVPKPNLNLMNQITDLHRESVDHITIPSKQGKGDLKRVEEVRRAWVACGDLTFDILAVLRREFCLIWRLRVVCAGFVAVPISPFAVVTWCVWLFSALPGSNVCVVLNSLPGYLPPFMRSVLFSRLGFVFLTGDVHTYLPCSLNA